MSPAANAGAAAASAPTATAPNMGTTRLNADKGLSTSLNALHAIPLSSFPCIPNLYNMTPEPLS